MSFFQSTRAAAVFGACLTISCAANTADTEEPRERVGVVNEAVQRADGTFAAALGGTSAAAAAVVARPPMFSALDSIAQGTRLRFNTNDTRITRLVIFRLSTEEGVYRRIGTEPTNPWASYEYVDTTAALNQEYCYIIGAYAAGQTSSSQSERRCVYHNGGASALPPTAPTGLRFATAREHSLELAFEDASTDETSFTVERGGWGTWTTIGTLPAAAGTGTTLNFTDSDLDMEQSYCYRVRAHGVNGSSLSFYTCGKTAPLAVTDPVPYLSPVIVTITHPEPGRLNVSWLDPSGGAEWEVRVFDGLDTWVSTTTARDHTAPPARRQAMELRNLEPGKLYCFEVYRQGLGTSPKLCESAYGARTSEAQHGPTAAQLPYIESIDATNNSLHLRIGNPQPGQVIERTYVSTGARQTFRVFPQATAELYESQLSPGRTYCYRLFVFDPQGSRYSNIACGTTSANVPPAPQNLHVSSQEGVRVGLDWDNSPNATGYDLEFHGRRDGYLPTDGSHETQGSSFVFDGTSHEGYEYCFKVRAKNQIGASGWTELCNVSLGDDGVTTYPARLVNDTPVNGIVLFWHTVNPGFGKARLTAVEVVGGSFTQYNVKFLPPGSTRADCATKTGVVIAPGGTLTGPDLQALYGDAEPVAPISLVACKGLVQPNDSAALNAIPINVTYRR